jgi:nucleotide-binding universal stress UspA family protein
VPSAKISGAREAAGKLTDGMSVVSHPRPVQAASTGPVLLAIDAKRPRSDPLDFAATLASSRQQKATMLAMVEVPHRHELAVSDRAHSNATQLFAGVRDRLDADVSLRVVPVRPGGQAGCVIGEVARCDADSLVMPLALGNRNVRGRLFALTTEHILKDCPCRVLMTHPTPQPASGIDDTKTVMEVIEQSGPSTFGVGAGIFVPVFGQDADEDSIAIAAMLATRRKQSRLDISTTVVLPTRDDLTLPVDTQLLALHRHRLHAAATLAAQLGIENISTHLLTARRAGEAFVEQAQRVEADSIVISAGARRRSNPSLGGLYDGRIPVGVITEHILSHARSPVVVTSSHR